MKHRRKLQPLAINPLVVDLSHHNDVADFGAVKAAGIAGIIHKATEGVGFTDQLYADRRGRAPGVGLLWGAYHFLRPGDFFLKVAAPDNTTLHGLDHTRMNASRSLMPRNFCSGWRTRSAARLWTELKRLGLSVICIDARHARAVLKMQINKSDRNDAAGIARIMQTGWFK